jgi:hypothetical protein
MQCGLGGWASVAKMASLPKPGYQIGSRLRFIGLWKLRHAILAILSVLAFAF